MNVEVNMNNNINDNDLKQEFLKLFVQNADSDQLKLIDMLLDAGEYGQVYKLAEE